MGWSPPRQRRTKSSTSALGKSRERRGRNTWLPSTAHIRWLSSGRGWRLRCGCTTNFRRFAKFRSYKHFTLYEDQSIIFIIIWSDWTGSGNRFGRSARYRRGFGEESLYQGIYYWWLIKLQSMRCYLCVFQKILMDSNSSQEIINVGFVKNKYLFRNFYLIFRNLWMTCWKKQRLCELLNQPWNETKKCFHWNRKYIHFNTKAVSCARRREKIKM